MIRPPTDAGGQAARRVYVLVAATALVWAGYSAWALRWTTDDAFISFRYARNLVEGLGLVFNAGERVEGYTNLLWTLWVAAGLSAGFAAESWANAWGGLCYVGSVLLLALNGHRLRGRGPGLWLPVAAVGASLHGEWSAWATGGLETSAFTFLLLAGFLLVVWNLRRPAALAAAGLVFALASLTRPDGLLPAAVVGSFVLGFGRPRLGSAASYALGFGLIWLPATLWRVGYYGEFFPNTYYAKSAYLAWYSQGWRYLSLYYEKYALLLLGPLMLVAAAALRRLGSGLGADPDRREHRAQALLAAALLIAYTFYVVRVGGDFMFARLLVPTAPFLLLLFEQGFAAAFRNRPAWGSGLALATLAGLWLTPHPLPDGKWRYGVANERLYYSEKRVAGLDHSAEVLGRTFDGLPVRVAFYGDEARIVYKARFPVAIESHAGLTDPEVARQTLDRRRRPGHEKHASARYLIEDRRAHFTFSAMPRRLLQLDRWIPDVVVRFDDDVWGQVLHWDPALMDALARRGVKVPGFIAHLDRYIERIDSLPGEQVAADYERFKRFYFDHTEDPARQAAFLRRIKS